MPCGDCKLEISELTVAISRKLVVHMTKTLPVVKENPVQGKWKTHGRPAKVSLFPI